MTTAYSTNLGLALPVQGELSGTWGNMVNYGITDYVDIAVAGTLTLSGDGAVTLANTNGTSAGTNIGSTTAQYAVLRITGTLTTTKVITAPSTSKTYIVDNAATGGSVTVKASGQTGVSIAVGEKSVVFFNGTDYVKIASSLGITSVSVASSNGLAGTSSGGLTPTLTLSTSVNGIVKGNGTSLSAATAGTDYVAPGTATTFTATQTFSGSATTVGAVLKNAAETTTVSATAATGTINYDALTQSVLYYTSNASANWTINLRGDGSTTMNSLLSTGQALTVVHLVTQGTTAYYNNVVQVDGTTSGVTTKWQGVAPTGGNPSGIDVYSYTIIKTAATPAYTVLAAQTQFK